VDERDYMAATLRVDFDIWLFGRTLQAYYRNWDNLSLEDSSAWQLNNRLGLRVPL
jgi:hypothetical protein